MASNPVHLFLQMAYCSYVYTPVSTQVLCRHVSKTVLTQTVHAVSGHTIKLTTTPPPTPPPKHSLCVAGHWNMGYSPSPEYLKCSAEGFRLIQPLASFQVHYQADMLAITIVLPQLNKHEPVVESLPLHITRQLFTGQ